MRNCPLLSRYGVPADESGADNSRLNWVKDICTEHCPLTDDCVMGVEHRPPEKILTLLASTELPVTLIKKRDRVLNPVPSLVAFEQSD